MSALFRKVTPLLVRGGGVRTFHQSGAFAIKTGDSFPDVEVMEDSPGNKLSLGKELQKHANALVIGVPAAFSPACSATHVPGYVEAKSGVPTYVVSVNDPFVMKAWGESFVGGKQAGVRFIADTTGNLTKALEMEFDSEPIFGNKRSKRFAMFVKNGKVEQVFVEPDNTGVKESAAGVVLKALGLAK